jgi:hypothetical protein
MVRARTTVSNWQCTAPYGEDATKEDRLRSCTQTTTGKLGYQECINSCNTGKRRPTMYEHQPPPQSAQSKFLSNALLYHGLVLAAAEIGYLLYSARNKRRRKLTIRSIEVFEKIQEAQIEYIDDLKTLSREQKVAVLQLLGVTYELMISTYDMEFSDADIIKLFRSFDALQKKVNALLPLTKQTKELHHYLSTITVGMNDAILVARPSIELQPAWWKLWK